MSRTSQIVSRFPAFYQSGDTENLFYRFVGVFAYVLDKAEEDLIAVMRTHWVNTADNRGSKGFDATEKGDLDKIFGLYLESLGGTVLLKQGTRRPGPDGKADDDLYRTRILGLIQVLKNGASTKQGIVDIVAANLGILPDLPYALEAKSDIRIIEFLPETTNSVTGLSVALFQDIVQTNNSPVPAVPEFRLHFHNELPAPLINPRITLTTTQQAVQFIGTIKPGDDLYFLSDGTGLHNGVPFQPKGILILPPGPANLRLEAEIGLPVGSFNHTFFDFSQFDMPTVRSFGQFNLSAFDAALFAYAIPMAQLEVRYLRLRPGSFTVRIPWDIPGFSANIVLNQHTLDRLADFGVPQTILDALPPLLNQEFKSRESFFAAIAQALEAETGIVELNRKNIGRLNLYAVPAALINKSLSLLDQDSGIALYPHLRAYLEALAPLKEAEKKALYGALGILLKPGSPLELVLRESRFTDKFARFNISPRGQIKTIVDRVKAVGVYAVIAFEKRFFEDQQLAEQVGLVVKQNPDDQEMAELNFDIASTQNTTEQQEMSDFFTASGLFDYTSFNTLNTFA